MRAKKRSNSGFYRHRMKKMKMETERAMACAFPPACFGCGRAALFCFFEELTNCLIFSRAVVV